MTYTAPQVDNSSDFLFTNPTPQPEPTPEPFYEVPVTEPPVVESTNNDRLTEIENLLNNNGINYKAYSNANGHCIIIEI